MATPRKGYWLDGERLPSVTTVLGARKDAGGLIRWANAQGLEGKTLEEARAGAPEAGTLAHDGIEAYIHGVDYFRDSELPGLIELHGEDVVRLAREGFASFLDWYSHSGIIIDPAKTELTMISKAHRFGGTPDAIGEFRGKTILLDWKVSKGLYADYVLQIAAYTKLVEENFPGMVIDSAHLCRFSKGVPVFTHVRMGKSVLDTAWEGFWHLRQAYDVDKWMKKNRIV